MIQSLERKEVNFDGHSTGRTTTYGMSEGNETISWAERLSLPRHRVRRHSSVVAATEPVQIPREAGPEA